MNELIKAKIDQIAQGIVYMQERGLSKDDAIRIARSQSTLGPKSWELIMELVEDYDKRTIITL